MVVRLAIYVIPNRGGPERRRSVSMTPQTNLEDVVNSEVKCVGVHEVKERRS